MRPANDEEEEGALAEEEGVLEVAETPTTTLEQEEERAAFGAPAVYGAREAVSLLRDLVQTQIQAAPTADEAASEYYKLGLKNAFETLSEYAHLFQTTGEELVRHLFAEVVLKPAKVGALKRLVFKETGAATGRTVRHRPGGGEVLKRRRANNATAAPPVPAAAAAVDDEVPSTVVKWPPDSSLSDISSD